MSLKKRFTGDYTIESIDSGSKIESHADGTILIGSATTVIPVLDGVEAGRYEIASVGTTDFTAIGADDNIIGTVFTMNAVAPLGTGTVSFVSVLTVDGDLTVLGTATTINSVDTEIVDNIIVLNSGEQGNGVTLGTSGLEIDRGGFPTAGIQFNEGSDIWEVDVGDGGGFLPISTGASGILNVVEDLTPQLGGDLDLNGYLLTSGGGTGPNGDNILITPAANGAITVSTVTSGDITVTSAAAVIVTSTLADLTLTSGNDLKLIATLEVQVEQPLSLLNVAVPTLPDPGSLYNTISAGTVGLGGSGLYFVNDSITDELVSKKKAIAYSIIF